MNDTVETITKDLDELRHRARFLLAEKDASYLTPCQITGKAGIRVSDVSISTIFYLSVAMLKEFEKRLSVSEEWKEYQIATRELGEFKKNTLSEHDFARNLDSQEKYLYLCSAAECAEISLGIAAISVVREMTDEFSDTKVSE